MSATTETQTKTTKKLAEHPSYESMIIAALSHLKERNGSSRPAVKKFVLANYKVTQGAHFDSQISSAIRRGVTKNVFSLPKGISGTIKLVKPEKKAHADKKVIKKVSASKIKKVTPAVKEKKTTSASKTATEKKKSAPTTATKKKNVASKVKKAAVTTA